MKWLEKYADYAYALLRIATGFMFAFHGAQKILGVLSEFSNHRHGPSSGSAASSSSWEG